MDQDTPAAQGPFAVRLSQTGEIYSCQRGETLLQGMLKLGRRGIPVGCVNGGCGVCKVRVCRGRCVETGAVSRQHVSEADRAGGVTLACRAAPDTDVELEVIGKMQRGLLGLIGPCANAGGG